MRITEDMIERARRAEFDYHQRNRLLGVTRFIPTPDDVIRAMLEAVLAEIPDRPVAVPDPDNSDEAGKARALSIAPSRPAIVTAQRPRRR